jgi:hypothetical protein
LAGGGDQERRGGEEGFKRHWCRGRAARPRHGGAGGAAATLRFGRADHGIGGWQQSRRWGASSSSLPSTLAEGGAGSASYEEERELRFAANADALMAVLLVLPPPRTVIPLTNSAPVPVGGGRWRAEDCGGIDRWAAWERGDGPVAEVFIASRREG